MSLRTGYTGTLDTKLAQARAAGRDFIIVTNLADLTTQLATQANTGTKSFTLVYTLSYQPTDLRLNGPLWEAFKTGVLEGLASEDIMGNEIVVSLNTTDTQSTRVNLKFSF